MKRILYALALISFSACNSKSTNTTQGGLSGLQTAPTATTEKQAGLLTNPEHGKPGHDCALPVGAPLTQKTAPQQLPAPITTVPTAPQPAVTAPQPAATKPISSAKINPAHGQPGHDCAKPVGAPLS